MAQLAPAPQPIIGYHHDGETFCPKCWATFSGAFPDHGIPVAIRLGDELATACRGESQAHCVECGEGIS